MTSVLDRIRLAVDDAVDVAGPRVSGEVVDVRGLSVTVRGIPARVGDLVLIGTRDHVPAEVVAVQNDTATCLPLGAIAGIGGGDRVTATGKPMTVGVGEGLLGRVLDVEHVVRRLGPHADPEDDGHHDQHRRQPAQHAAGDQRRGQSQPWTLLAPQP